MDSRMKKLTQYVVPTILGNCAYFLFTIIDGIFVGQGVGTDALGAVNLVWPFVMVLNAIIMLTVVGGVTVSAVRIGRGDIAGANQAFMHSLAGTLTAALVMMLIGTCLTSQIATLLGANETTLDYTVHYLRGLVFAFRGAVGADDVPEQLLPQRRFARARERGLHDRDGHQYLP